MTGTFGSLNIAKTGLQYQQLALDVADNNISNATTDGYVRKRSDGVEIGGSSSPTMWSTYTGHGDGVSADGVKRLSDVLLDTRVRTETSNLSYLTVQQSSLSNVEAGVDEPSTSGFAQAISDFTSSLQDLANNPQLESARETVLARATTLVASANSQAQNLADESSNLDTNASEDLSAVNDDASQIAHLNHVIFVAQANGTDVSDLQDTRDSLALDMATKAGAVVDVQADGRYTVKVNGVTMVDGTAAGDDNAGTLTATSTSPLTISLTSPDNTLSNLGPLNGELGGIQAMVNVTIPGYRAGLDAVVKKLADNVNAVQQAGYDLNGNPAAGTSLFTYNASDPAGTLAVGISNSDQLAASATAGQQYDGTNADKLSAAANVSVDYQTLVSKLGAIASGINSQTTNQQALVTQVGNEQQQLSGVSTDEETINIMAAQRSYQASARVLSVLDNVLDTLINHTGSY